MKNTFGGTLENIEQSLKSSNESIKKIEENQAEVNKEIGQVKESIKKIEENQAEVNMEIGQVKKTIDKNQAAVKTEFGRINKELGRIGMTSGQIGERFAKIDLAEMFGKEFAKSLHITNLVGLVLWFSRKSGSPNEMDTLVGLADKVAWALAARDGKHLPTYLKLLKFSPEQIEQFIAQLDNPTKGDSLFKLLSDVEESLKGQAGAKTVAVHLDTLRKYVKSGKSLHYFIRHEDPKLGMALLMAKPTQSLRFTLELDCQGDTTVIGQTSHHRFAEVKVGSPKGARQQLLLQRDVFAEISDVLGYNHTNHTYEGIFVNPLVSKVLAEDLAPEKDMIFRAVNTRWGI
eukprot:Colp12_sorted_trinity150504_noHs@15342